MRAAGGDVVVSLGGAAGTPLAAAWQDSDALAQGVDIAGINVMTMDYGDGAAPDPEGQMGEYAIEAVTSLHGQMTSADQLRSFAWDQGMGLLSMWSVNRDHPEDWQFMAALIG